MPLDAEHVGLAVPADRLHQPVVGHRFHLHLAPQVLDRLVMDGIDRGARQAAVQLGQAGVGQDADAVEVVVVVFLVVMGHGAGALGRQVLVQAAAEGDVEQLHAAAHAQHRLAAADEGEQQLDLEAVAHRIAAPLGPQGLFAVAQGAHVGAALENEAVQFLDVVADRHVAAANDAFGLDGGQHQDHGAPGHGPVGQGLLHVLQGLALETELGRHVVQDAGREAYLGTQCRHGTNNALRAQRDDASLHRPGGGLKVPYFSSMACPSQ